MNITNLFEKFKSKKGDKMKKIVLIVYMIILCSVVLYSEPPTNVEINIDNDISTLSWSDSTNADFYFIYRSTKSDTDFVKIDSVIVTTYIDSGAGFENKYFYYVTAVDDPTITVTDIDGNIYQTVHIGNQLWMAENLKVTHYRNGDAIPHLTSDGDWTSTNSGAYCVYDNTASNADTYGNLYNWYALDDARNIAPEGWHVPTDDEIKELEMALGMTESEANDTQWRGTNEGSKLAGRADLWTDGVLEGNAEFCASGFSFLPGGFRDGSLGDFYSMFDKGYFWSSTENSIFNAWSRNLYYYHTEVYRSYSGSKHYGFSVRCVRD